MFDNEDRKQYKGSYIDILYIYRLLHLHNEMYKPFLGQA